MSNLDHLISKILSDCEEKSKQIIKDANTEASKIIKQSVDSAEKEKENILSDAELEAKKTAERILSGKRLEIRDDNLNVKRETINKAFDLAMKKFNDMSENEYKRFLFDQILALNLDGGEVLFPPQCHPKIVDELNAFLKNNDKPGNLRVYNGERSIDGGFILIKDGIEYNFTFPTLLQYLRNELEGEIIKTLF